MNSDAIPIAGIFAGTVIVVMAAIELGHRRGLANHRRGHDDKDSATSTISSEVTEIHASRIAVGLQARIPWEIWLVLIDLHDSMAAASERARQAPQLLRRTANDE